MQLNIYYYYYYYYYYYCFTTLWVMSRTTQVSRYQKGKTNLDLLEKEIVSVGGIGWAICKSAPCPRQITHTHTQPFYGSVEFVRDNPGEPVPER